MTKTQTELELALQKYDRYRTQTIHLHNACSNGLDALRDQMWRYVVLYEEVIHTLQSCLAACVEEQSQGCTVAIATDPIAKQEGRETKQT